MSDRALVPLSATEAALVTFPLDLPREDRAAWLADLSDETLAACERVPLPGATVAPSDPLPTED